MANFLLSCNVVTNQLCKNNNVEDNVCWGHFSELRIKKAEDTSQCMKAIVLNAFSFISFLHNSTQENKIYTFNSL